MSQSTASLRIFGDDLVPKKVSLLIGGQPTRWYCKGDIKPLESGKQVVRKTGMWLRAVKEREPEDLDSQIAELFSGLTSDLNIWQTLSTQFDVSIFTGFFMDKTNTGFCLSPETTNILSNRNIKIHFDIYSPDTEIIATDKCPCESGKTYAECCSLKSTVA